MRDFFAPGRSPVRATHGACAASHPLAAAEALSVLRAGGSAADAAVAAVAVQCVVEPHMTGVGGDCFVLVKRAGDDAPAALNGSGFCAAGVSAAAVREAEGGAMAETSPHSVTVPGAVAAWRQLHKRYGRLPWRGLFQAAIRYAESGFPVSDRVALDWHNYRARLQADEDARAAYLPDGAAPAAGAIFKLPALAQTLSAIAGDGGRSFYRGDIAAAMLDKLRRCGSKLSADDFMEYKARWQTPLSAMFRGWRVWECAPNAQGVVALRMLRRLDAEAPGAFDGARLRRFAEATASAYRWRDAEVGDAERDWAAAMAAHRDTVYLSVIDGGGLAVSLINSIFHPFGSGLYAPDVGVLFHNRGLSFSLADGHINALAPRKRPLHTLIPAIADGADGELLSFGVMGGDYQAAGHAWFLSRLLDDGDDLQQALDAPRFFNYPDALWAEPRLPRHLREALAAAGYDVRLRQEPLGGGQAVLRRADGALIAASDSRKDGLAIGF